MAAADTTPNIFQVKKLDAIFFGDLEDLKNVQRTFGHSPHDKFFLGNYSLSLLKFDDDDDSSGTSKKSVAIFHQENVDPNLVIKEMLEWKKGSSPPHHDDQGTNVVDTTTKDVFGPSDWLAGHQQHRAAAAAEAETRFENKEPPTTTDGRNTCLKLSWSGRPAEDANSSNATDDLVDQLFYFIDRGQGGKPPSPPPCFEYWFSHLDHPDDFDIVYSTNEIYKLVKKGVDIGSAINLKSIFRGGGGGISGVLYRDREEGDCFALVLHEFSERDGGYSLGQMRNRSFVFPIESFLYGTTERSFYKNGVAIDNSYYGAAGGASASDDFSRLLPDEVLLKILQYSPWRRRVLCRRVDRRWLAMCNKAISIDTPILTDQRDKKFEGIRPSDLKWLLPIVCGGLEQMTFRWDEFVTFLEPAFLSSMVPSFPKLRKIDFRYVDDLTSIQFEAFIMLLEKSGSLKEVVMDVPETVAPPPTRRQHSSAGFEQVDKFECNIPVGYPQLAWIMEYFPQLTSLSVLIRDSVTVSELSGVIERYARTLTHLKVNNDALTLFADPATTGSSFTTLGECHNLEYCALHSANYVSDEFLVALATGCPKLGTLVLHQCKDVTNDGLAALALLPSLKRLNISSSTNDPTAGLTQIAQKGNLEQIVANYTDLTVDCLKIVVRHCPQLKLLSIISTRRGAARISIDEAKEIVNLYGKWGRSAGRLILRSNDPVWRNRKLVQYIQSTKAQRNQRDFVVQDRRTTRFLDEERSNYEEGEDEDEDEDEDDYVDYYGPDDFGYGHALGYDCEGEYY